MIQIGSHLPVTHLAGEARTLGDLFRKRAGRSAAVPALYVKREERWVATTWAQFHDAASRIARGLIELDLQPGERVAILGPTLPPWAEYDMGAQLAGLCSFGIYPQQTVEQIRYLLEHSDARVIFVEGEAELRTVIEAARAATSAGDRPDHNGGKSARLRAIVPWRQDLYDRFVLDEHHPDGPPLLSPSHFQRQALTEAEEQERQARIDPEDTAILIYTSGTTGPPKGAMISHRNILSVLGNQGDFLTLHQDDLSLSFLPMAHAAERVLAFFGRISAGIATAYASSTAAVLTEILEVQPTLFGSVPRIFEKAYSQLHARVSR